MNRMLGRRLMMGSAAGAGILALPAISRAQEFPGKTVRIVVPYPAGGGTDIVARLIAPHLAERWKQTVIIDNKPGASGVVGSDIVAKSAPDGHTLLVTTGAHALNPYMIKSMPYDTLKDFTPITSLVKSGTALVGSVKAGMDTMDKFVAAARAKPGTMVFGSTENFTRMTGELFRVRSGLKIENVAYKGGAPMMQELVGGHIPAGVTSPLTAMSFLQAGTVRMLALIADRRLEMLPDVPTMAELGIPGMDRPGWFAMLGPAGMAPAVLRRIHADTAAALAMPEVVARIRTLASTPGGESPAEFDARVRGDMQVWGEVARLANISPE